MFFFLLAAKSWYISKRRKGDGKTVMLLRIHTTFSTIKWREALLRLLHFSLTRDTPLITNNAERTEHFTDGEYMRSKIIHKSGGFFFVSHGMQTLGATVGSFIRTPTKWATTIQTFLLLSHGLNSRSHEGLGCRQYTTCAGVYDLN